MIVFYGSWRYMSGTAGKRQTDKQTHLAKVVAATIAALVVAIASANSIGSGG